MEEVDGIAVEWMGRGRELVEWEGWREGEVRGGSYCERDQERDTASNKEKGGGSE